jgi:hypothetical protein
VPLLQDDSHWPVVIDAVIGEPSDEDIRRYNARRAERLARAERHVQLIDARSGMRMSPRHRKMIAEFDMQNREAQRRYLAGVALVVTSVVLRAVLRAIYRVTPSVCPRRPCRSLDEATSWARALL